MSADFKNWTAFTLPDSPERDAAEGGEPGHRYLEENLPSNTASDSDTSMPPW